MKVRILYDGACPFCDDYVRYQELRAAAGGELELIDAREHPEAMAGFGVGPAELEDGMVVLVGEERFHGAEALHALSRLSKPPGRWWVRAVAAASRSPGRARFLYPILKAGRRVALALLGIKRFPG